MTVENVYLADLLRARQAGAVEVVRRIMSFTPGGGREQLLFHIGQVSADYNKELEDERRKLEESGERG